jgi:hypothetical protein
VCYKRVEGSEHEHQGRRADKMMGTVWNDIAHLTAGVKEIAFLRCDRVHGERWAGLQLACVQNL